MLLELFLVFTYFGVVLVIERFWP